MADSARLQVRTNLNPEIWEDVGAGSAGVPVPVTVEGTVAVSATGLATETTLSTISTILSATQQTNTIDEASATVTYIGKENAAAVWSILKIDTTSGTVFTYATIVNNAAQTSGYATAWAARASLTYSQYSVAF